MSKGMQIALGATVIALLLGWYTATNLEAAASFSYFQHLDDFRAAEAQQVGNAARVHGYVAIGSIRRDVAGKQVHFSIVNDPPHAGGSGPPFPVVFVSLETPDLFKDGAEVVVEGTLTGVGDPFRADKVLAKCPSKFEAADPAGQQGSF
ncbi:MAG: cytochrome c maturation protein CcmE [Myxococcota bacterium]|nr:cytochrome c maturation protein CcmE [bacterium]MDP6074024.1 cytochrome c maturation protein CcmE [Myxococcota bacterium]MDP6244177.1 cytochrome c maturation protein CcmE [Myxococcota bacterium]MDP7073455.1 cytochrome c maturation protein CcmE [Myxococcota bacterium]MDP7300032.1 cytochrome c maturation protein CcmE [Myxococcota bacterium]